MMDDVPVCVRAYVSVYHFYLHIHEITEAVSKVAIY